MRRRALLLSGGVGPSLDFARYRNDVAAFADVPEGQGFASNEVRKLVSADATRAAVLSSLAWLAQLTTGDVMTLVVTDHGHPSGLCVWGHGQYLTPRELRDALAGSKAWKILIYRQCHAGVFADVPPTAVACCACAATDWSHGCPPEQGGEAAHDEFLYHLAAAFGGWHPDAALCPWPPPLVTVGAAFRFEESRNRWRTCRNPACTPETPELVDPEGLAERLTLRGMLP